jgi:hypothetical protein
VVRGRRFAKFSRILYDGRARGSHEAVYTIGVHRVVILLDLGRPSAIHLRASHLTTRHHLHHQTTQHKMPPSGPLTEQEIWKIARRTTNIIESNITSNVCLFGSAASSLWADIGRVPNVRRFHSHSIYLFLFRLNKVAGLQCTGHRHSRLRRLLGKS